MSDQRQDAVDSAMGSVLSHLDFKSAAVATAVCKRWHALLQQPLSHSIASNRCLDLCTGISKPKTASRPSKKQQSRVHKQLTSILDSLLLQYVRSAVLPAHADTILLLQRMTALRSLRLLECGFWQRPAATDTLVLTHLTQLRDLTIGGAGDVHAAGIVRLDALPTTLKTLNLKEDSYLFPEAGFTSEQLAHLVALPHLQRLVLKGLAVPCWHTLQWPVLPSLQSLVLHNHGSDEELRALPDLATYLPGVTRLEVIGMGRCSHQASLASLRRPMELHLGVDACWEVFDGWAKRQQALLAILSSFENLVSLHITQYVFGPSASTVDVAMFSSLANLSMLYMGCKLQNVHQWQPQGCVKVINVQALTQLESLALVLDGAMDSLAEPFFMVSSLPRGSDCQLSQLYLASTNKIIVQFDTLADLMPLVSVGIAAPQIFCYAVNSRTHKHTIMPFEHVVEDLVLRSMGAALDWWRRLQFIPVCRDLLELHLARHDGQEDFGHDEERQQQQWMEAIVSAQNKRGMLQLLNKCLCYRSWPAGFGKDYVPRFEDRAGWEEELAAGAVVVEAAPAAATAAAGAKAGADGMATANPNSAGDAVLCSPAGDGGGADTATAAAASNQAPTAMVVDSATE